MWIESKRNIRGGGRTLKRTLSCRLFFFKKKPEMGVGKEKRGGGGGWNTEEVSNDCGNDILFNPASILESS